ncbi:MAG: hypothetical protein ACLRSW_04980 [Christensenellaceae bacterium]
MTIKEKGIHKTSWRKSKGERKEARHWLTIDKAFKGYKRIL